MTSKNVFLLFFEAKRFLIISPYQLVCALLLRENQKGGKRYKNIFKVDEIIKKRKRFSKKDKKTLCLCTSVLNYYSWKFVKIRG